MKAWEWFENTFQVSIVLHSFEIFTLYRTVRLSQTKRLNRSSLIRNFHHITDVSAYEGKHSQSQSFFTHSKFSLLKNQDIVTPIPNYLSQSFFTHSKFSPKNAGAFCITYRVFRLNRSSLIRNFHGMIISTLKTVSLIFCLNRSSLIRNFHAGGTSSWSQVRSFSSLNRSSLIRNFHLFMSKDIGAKRKKKSQSFFTHSKFSRCKMHRIPGSNIYMSQSFFTHSKFSLTLFNLFISKNLEPIFRGSLVFN